MEFVRIVLANILVKIVLGILARRAIAERVANVSSIREFFIRIVVGGSAFLTESVIA